MNFPLNKGKTIRQVGKYSLEGKLTLEAGKLTFSYLVFWSIFFGGTSKALVFSIGSQHSK